jgi:hypothetical protein
MKRRIKLATMLCVLMPLTAFAGWQMVTPTATGNQPQPFFQAGSQAQINLIGVNATPDLLGAASASSENLLAKPYDTFHATLSQLQGTLKDNITNIVTKSGWKIKWKSNDDFQVIGTSVFSGKDLYTTLAQILNNYPLQATFYKKNKIVTITSRKLA